MTKQFERFAKWIAKLSGKASTFAVSVAVVVVWAVTGPIFQYSDTWQLIINTGTTVVTFWLVFIIQNTQYRDTEAIQLKLDELIRANVNASNRMQQIETLTEDELDTLRRKQQSVR